MVQIQYFDHFLILGILVFSAIRGMRHTNNAVVPMNAMFIQQLVYHKVHHKDISMIPTIEPLYAMIETAIPSRQLQLITGSDGNSCLYLDIINARQIVQKQGKANLPIFKICNTPFVVEPCDVSDHTQELDRKKYPVQFRIQDNLLVLVMTTVRK